MQDGTAELRIRRLSNFAANGLPVGFEYFTINKNIRTGSLPLLGGLYSRELYADLWSWVQEQPGYLITETEWQSKSQANNGNVPFYSSGDGSTTFRVPSLKCWVKGANGIEEVGSYLAAGLPNIEGASDVGGYSYKPAFPSPLFPATSLFDNAIFATVTRNDVEIVTFGFNASLANPIYGNSEEVTPESIVGLYCVIAFSTISNVGNLDVQTLYNKIIELEGKLENADSTPTGTILVLLDDEVPEGYLPAEGAAISRTTYADLFNIIGTKFGEGDGSTTFNLPNLVGKFLEGNDTPGTVKVAGLPNIAGSISLNSGETEPLSYADSVKTSDALFVTKATSSGDPDVDKWASGGRDKGTSIKAISFSAKNSNSIYGKSTTVQSSAITVKFVIKY